jgi:hypothetical protein
MRRFIGNADTKATYASGFMGLRASLPAVGARLLLALGAVGIALSMILRGD